MESRRLQESIRDPLWGFFINGFVRVAIRALQELRVNQGWGVRGAEFTGAFRMHFTSIPVGSYPSPFFRYPVL